MIRTFIQAPQFTKAWEFGYNKPSGSSNRLIKILANDVNIIKKFPFVVESK